jgi:hypothetical protein
MTVSVTDASCRWGHRSFVCGSLTQHNTDVHPCCNTCRDSIPVQRQVTLHCMAIPPSAFPATSWWAFGFNPLFSHYEYCCHGYLWTNCCEDVFNCLGYVPKNTIAGSRVTLCWIFWRSTKQSSTGLHHFTIHQQWTSISVSPPPQHVTVLFHLTAVLICIFLICSCQASFQVLVGHLCIFFGEMFIQIL